MLIVIICVFLSFFIRMAIFSLGIILYFRGFFNREKSSPFECGFDPKNSARIPFSTRFFLLAVIFLVFDIEIVLIIPLPLIIFNRIIYEVLIGGLFFLLILVLGLLHE